MNGVRMIGFGLIKARKNHSFEHKFHLIIATYFDEI